MLRLSELDTKFNELILIKVKQLDEFLVTNMLMLVLYFSRYYKILFYFVDLIAVDSWVENIRGVIQPLFCKLLLCKGLD